ncbi:hypothetical protein ACFSUS_12985 [Spirosoma soli]|uniref:Uncharacterized protein n=1 Tax=Spirosoma soli TaxID=1770529 RepID=A0ABW5M7A4_9BACT
MNTISYLRLTLLVVFFATVSLFAQAQVRKAPIVSREGFWVIETPAKSRQCTVRFYTNQNELIYEETVERRLNINRRQTKRNLNAALEQAMFVWNATHKVPSDRQWVAIQFDRNK